jgi:hypothetical protein
MDAALIEQSKIKVSFHHFSFSLIHLHLIRIPYSIFFSTKESNLFFDFTYSLKAYCYLINGNFQYEIHSANSIC